MRMSILPLLATLAALAAAQGPNAFNIPSGGLSGIAAGQSKTIQWSNPQGSTVTIQLRQGPSGSLGAPITLASHIQNTGSTTLMFPADLVQGSDYALEIIDDDDTNLNNFSPQFSISSSNTASSSASTASMTSSGSSSMTSMSSSASMTGSSSMSSASASSTSSGSSSSSSSTPTSNPAPVVQVGGSLLAVALGFAVAL